jgi:hypothetical protein
MSNEMSPRNRFLFAAGKEKKKRMEKLKRTIARGKYKTIEDHLPISYVN